MSAFSLFVYLVYFVVRLFPVNYGRAPFLTEHPAGWLRSNLWDVFYCRGCLTGTPGLRGYFGGVAATLSTSTR